MPSIALKHTPCTCLYGGIPEVDPVQLIHCRVVEDRINPTHTRDWVMTLTSAVFEEEPTSSYVLSCFRQAGRTNASSQGSEQAFLPMSLKGGDGQV